jgi:hydrogenase maturation protease
MKPITIIGIGSPFGADQVGWQLTDILKKDHSLQTLTNGQIRFVICEHPPLVLLDYIADAAYVILIDAIEGGQRGNIVHVTQHQLLDIDAVFSTHDLGVKEVLLLGHQLDALPRHVELYGVEVGDVTMEYTPRPETVQLLKILIYQQIQNYLSSQ